VRFFGEEAEVEDALALVIGAAVFFEARRLNQGRAGTRREA